MRKDISQQTSNSCEPFSIVDEHVVGIDDVQILSLTAIARSRSGPLPDSVLGSAMYTKALTLGFFVSIARRE
jgi:hypothetical protein